MADHPDWLPDALADVGAHERESLPDGRELGYARFGALDGDPIVLCHGTPGSRWLGAIVHDTARANGVQVVTVERPGVGRSSPRADRTIGNWPEDLDYLAETAGWDSFPVLGFSGGGPYALACAAGSPSLVSAVGLVAPAGPPEGPSGSLFERVVGRMARYTPGLLGRLFSRYARSVRDDDPLSVADSLTAEPVLDEPVAEGATAAEVLKTDLLGAVERTAEGVVRDFALTGQSWGIDLERIETPVHCWHGTGDENVPIAVSRHLEDRLPNATLHELDGEDHASALVRHRETVLRTLVS